MSDHFCLKWNNHQTTLVSVFDKLLEDESLVDCTLAADGKYMKAHKVVLSACSSYLENILRNHEDKHPILIFNDISFIELKAMLEYMYKGEVNVSQEQLNTFLKAAEALKIKGLTDQGGGGGGSDGGGGGGQDNVRRKMAAHNRKTQSPVMGMTPVERSSSPKRRKTVRRQSRDENFPNDSNSCDTAPTPPPAQSQQQVNSIAARIEEKVAKIKKESNPANNAEPPPGGNANTAGSLSALGMLQPKTEFMEEPGNVEDLTLEEEEEYGHNPGTSQGSFSSQDFNNWQLGDTTSDEVFMASQHDVSNSAGNSQGEMKKFTCDVCQRSYTYKRSLWGHKKYECGNEPRFFCTECQFATKYKRNLVSHFKKKHKSLSDCDWSPLKIIPSSTPTSVVTATTISSTVNHSYSSFSNG